MCQELGLEQKTRGPTHSAGNLLDLVLTDLQVKVEKHPKVADHNLLAVTLPLPEPRHDTVQREVWSWTPADWEGLRGELRQTSWEEVWKGSVTDAARWLTGKVLGVAEDWVPKRTVEETKEHALGSTNGSLTWCKLAELERGQEKRPRQCKGALRGCSKSSRSTQ